MLIEVLFFIFYFFQSDKASMLDEAIEYMKSLQLQLQVYIICKLENR